MSRPVAEVGSTTSSYEILAKLATGGMAEIFLARGASAAGVERYVVLKRVLREKATDVDFLRMFLDEARLAAQLQHPHIAQVYDIGKLGDSYFFTMEYVHGETVRGLLQRAHALRRPLPIATVLTIVAGAAAGLHHAHDRIGTDGRALGIVHRDVSPSNLMVSYEGAVKVVDFGVAKAAHRSHETRAGAVKGKIAYLSPEQCRGTEIDRRSDLFSLGIVMWEMLTTERLFKRSSDFENMAAIVGEDTAPPSSIRPDVPPELDAIVSKLLSKSPADRFQTADELHEALELAAVRTGSALSSAALGRLMRELFGQRPEPWIEMQTREAHPEVVTVTSEPLPAQIAIPVSGRIDLELEQVHDFSQARLQRASQDAIPTAAMGAVDPRRISQPPPPGAPIDADEAPTLLPHSAPHIARTSTGDQVASLQRTLPMGVTNDPSSPRSSPYPVHHTPSHGSGITPTHTPSRGSAQPVGAMPYDISRSVAPQAKPPRIPRIVLILGPAVILGIIIGIVVASGGSSDKPATPTVDTGSIAAAPADGASAMPMVVAPTPAPPATVAIDAAVAAAVAIEAAHHDDVKPVEHHTPPPKPPSDPVVSKRPGPPIAAATPPPPTIDELLAKNKISDAVAQCAASSSVIDKNGANCVIAACRTHETAKAKKWLQTVPSSKRSGLVATCKSAGTVLVEAPKPPRPNPADDCARDPMACMH